MRVAVCTDTLGDVNGVSRFIQNVAEHAHAAGRGLHVLTSTNFAVPDRPNIHNIAPIAARRMPRYEHLELVLPPAGRIAARLDELRPDVVHLSTPGPVGVVARRWALRRGVPVVGIYHTDFPAYVAHLWKRPWMGAACARAMRWFYRPFSRVVTRSASYIEPVAGLGVERGRIVTLQPGIDIARFRPHFRDPAVWARVGAPRLAEPGVNVLTVGRISVEKNLPLVVRSWRAARPELAARGLVARLVVVGDGPYRAQMQRELDAPSGGTPGTPSDVAFLGFRHGLELSQLFATGDLFVFPSATDTLGQVVMEAQASGLPALVSDVGGPREVIEPGVTGLVLPAADEQAWARAIVDMVADEPRRRAMGHAAAQRLTPMTIAASFEHYWRLHTEVARVRA